VESIEVVEKLRLGLVKLHLLSTRYPSQENPVVSTRGNRIEGMWLGKVEATVVLDEEPLAASGSKSQLAGFFRGQTADYRERYAWRFRTTAAAAEPATRRAVTSTRSCGKLS